MKPDYIEFQDRSVPLAYLITFRCYGTWLHGDERGSVDRRFFNRVGSPRIEHDEEKLVRKTSQMKHNAFVLRARERTIVENAMKEVCSARGYGLYALNVRTNHVHLVVGNSGTPERIMASFKAYATRALRTAEIVRGDGKVWSRHGSTRYLWTDEHVSIAVDYVINGQGDELPKFG